MGSGESLKGVAEWIGGVAEWFRRSVPNLVRSSVLGSSPTAGTILPQANSQRTQLSILPRSVNEYSEVTFTLLLNEVFE